MFSPSEWMAALRACGVEVMGYDRLADRMPLEKIVAWLEQLDATMSLQLENLSRENV